MNNRIILLLILLLLIGFGFFVFPVSALDDISITITEDDTRFLQTMNQIWIPDIYSIRGRLDLAICSHDAYPGLYNATIADAKVTLMNNMQEMLPYNLTNLTDPLRSDYQNITFSSFRVLNLISQLDPDSSGFEDNATVLADIIPVYGNWMAYRTHSTSFTGSVVPPDYASLPSKQIIDIMEELADTVALSADTRASEITDR
ncbi:MAG: hypothetical protein JXA44_10325 [Methanospirillaceae archaeon]|nr:hypothetical protein [Methanospirillaceae archaeon]